MTKCYICGRNLDSEAGWDWCDECRKFWDKSVVDLVRDGTLIIVEDDQGHIMFKPVSFNTTPRKASTIKVDFGKKWRKRVNAN